MKQIQNYFDSSQKTFYTKVDIVVSVLYNMDYIQGLYHDFHYIVFLKLVNQLMDISYSEV